MSDSASNTMPCEFLSLEDLLDIVSARRYRNGRLRTHEARVACHEGQQAHTRVGTQRIHDDIVYVDDAVRAGHEAEQARVLGLEGARFFGPFVLRGLF